MSLTSIISCKYSFKPDRSSSYIVPSWVSIYLHWGYTKMMKKCNTFNAVYLNMLLSFLHIYKLVGDRTVIYSYI